MVNDATFAARELYVYFHAPADRASEINAAVREMQQRLGSSFPGLEVALLRRPDDGSGRHTWMEIYAWAGGRVDRSTDDAFRQMLASETVGWQHLLDGQRHLEVFERCA
jgi:hypothetical protein